MRDSDLRLPSAADEWMGLALDEARRTFAALGDRDNGLHAALLQIRRLLLIGRVTEAGGALDKLDLRAAPAMLMARGELVAFEIALRRGRTTVVITSSPALLDVADRVIVLDGGAVTSEGTHRELLGRDSSYQLAVAR